MKYSTKLLAWILALGILYSFIKLFSGHGGIGLYDFFDALVYVSIILFLASLLLLIFNFSDYKKILLFTIIGIPLTFMAAIGMIQNIYNNRTPDLSVKYNRPINDIQFANDSTHIKVAIDSFVELKNRITGGAKIQYAFIDTIIYSQQGNKVFIVYINKFEPNQSDYDFYPGYLYGDTRNPDYWDLEETKYNLSGSFQDILSLKKAVRKFYFNQFTFIDKDSMKSNFFWRKIMRPGD